MDSASDCFLVARLGHWDLPVSGSSSYSIGASGNPILDMLTYDPVTDLRHWPTPMSRFGQNPYGQNLYRIVFSPSRRYLVVGEWPDGSQCAQWVVKHKNIGNDWIMERWLPAEQYAKCTREQWDQNMLILGPWPERGEYEHCHTFELSTPSDANIEKLITLIEASRNVRFYDTLNWHREDAERERKAIRNTAEDMIRNKLPAFGGRPMSAGKYGRTTQIPILRTAQELGLPTKPGFRQVSPRRAA